MPEKRQHRRHRRRYNVRFGEKDFSHSGFTYDLSSNGMFLVTTQLLPLHTRIHVQMFLDTARYVVFEAEVRRQKVVPVQLRTVEKGGMGLRLLPPSELMRELLDAGRMRITVTYPTAPAFAAAFERELGKGRLNLRVQRALAKDTKLTVELVLPFVPASLELEAVVGEAPAGAPDGVVTVMFEAPDAVAQLGAHLPG